jgi:hypothetical protein
MNIIKIKMDNNRINQENQNRMRIASIVVMLKCAIVDGRMPQDWDHQSDFDLIKYLSERYTVTPKELNDNIGI